MGTDQNHFHWDATSGFSNYDLVKNDRNTPKVKDTMHGELLKEIIAALIEAIHSKEGGRVVITVFKSRAMFDI